MSIASELKERFYNECEESFGFTREEIIAILLETGTKFLASEIPSYRNVIEQRYNERLRKEEKARLLHRPISEIACPICGADTFGDKELYGKYTHTEGWFCIVGGVKHYYWWRMNRMREQRGLPPIDFANVDWSSVKLDSEELNE